MRYTILGLVLITATLSAQDAQKPPRFRIGTNLVNVDVFATRDGVPVQDLTAADFEVYEDNVPQKIDSFEHIAVEPAGPQDTLVEPKSTRESLQLVADPRRRVFLLYLDTEHVDFTGSHNIKEPIINLLTRVLGADDLVGVMTPEMSPDQITFGRKTRVIEEGLRQNWIWGRRTSLMLNDRETLYTQCWPPDLSDPGRNGITAIAAEMIKRRRERIVLDSLHDVIRYMGTVREGRTAVIAVTDGWLLFAPNEALTQLRKNPLTGKYSDPIPGTPPPVGIGPGGTLTTRPQQDPYGGPNDRTECERDRMELAMADNARYFRDLLGLANKANVSFYPIDPRGLAVFDSDIGPDRPPSLVDDAAMLRNRRESLEVLALNTDGIALVNSNDLNKQIRRVADDLTSYYLIGYYSTNAKLDGKFRAIKVRVKRPGVAVRARSGYRAATEAEVLAARAEVSKPDAAAHDAIASAIGRIDWSARSGRGVRGTGEPALFHRGPSTGNQLQAAGARIFPRSERVHLEMEADQAEPVWTAVLLDRTGKTLPVPVATGERKDLATAQRILTADLALAPLGAGDYVIRLTRAGDRTSLLAIRVTQ